MANDPTPYIVKGASGLEETLKVDMTYGDEQMSLSWLNTIKDPENTMHGQNLFLQAHNQIFSGQMKDVDVAMTLVLTPVEDIQYERFPSFSLSKRIAIQPSSDADINEISGYVEK